MAILGIPLWLLPRKVQGHIFLMNWRDQLYQDESGRYKFLTTVNITNADLDEEYCRFGFIHEAVNGFASMGVKVGTV
jgi:hypothetical protein